MPAKVQISGSSGSELRIDGRFMGELPLPSHVEVPSGKHFFEFTANGHYPVMEERFLKNGEQADIHAELETTNQRKLSYYLFGLSGAALLSSTGFFTASFIKQSDAQSYLDIQKTRPLSVDEGTQYKDAKDASDQYRTIGFVSLIGSAAVGGVAALLYFIDHPKAHIPVIPVLNRDSVGAEFRTSF